MNNNYKIEAFREYLIENEKAENTIDNKFVVATNRHKGLEGSEEVRNPKIVITTDGILNTKVSIDGKEIKGVTGVRFSQNYKENHGLPILQIDLKATNVTLDTKMLPALPEPFKNHYISLTSLMDAGISKEAVTDICRKQGILLGE